MQYMKFCYTFRTIEEKSFQGLRTVHVLRMSCSNLREVAPKFLFVCFASYSRLGTSNQWIEHFRHNRQQAWQSTHNLLILHPSHTAVGCLPWIHLIRDLLSVATPQATASRRGLKLVSWFVLLTTTWFLKSAVVHVFLTFRACQNNQTCSPPKSRMQYCRTSFNVFLWFCHLLWEIFKTRLCRKKVGTSSEFFGLNADS